MLPSTPFVVINHSFASSRSLFLENMVPPFLKKVLTCHTLGFVCEGVESSPTSRVLKVTLLPMFPRVLICTLLPTFPALLTPCIGICGRIGDTSRAIIIGGAGGTSILGISGGSGDVGATSGLLDDELVELGGWEGKGVISLLFSSSMGLFWDLPNSTLISIVC